MGAVLGATGDWFSTANAIIAGVSLAAAAAVAGHYGLRQQRNAQEAKEVREDVSSLGPEVSEALKLVAKVVENDAEKDRIIAEQARTLTDVRRRLIECLEDAAER